MRSSIRAHLAHAAELLEEVLERELRLAHPGGELLGLALRHGLLRLLDEADDVAHAEDAPGEPLRVEHLEPVELLADAEEQDGLARDLPQRERGTAARVAVHLREHETVDADALGERLPDAHGLLPDHAVDDQDDLMRAHRALEVLELAHELIVDVQTAGGVEDEEIEPARAGLLERPDRDVMRLRAVRRAPEAGVGALGHALELIDGRGAVDVGRDEQRALVPRLEPQRELARERGLARALQAGEQDHGGHMRRARQSDAGVPEHGDRSRRARCR
jgi:hypothetical protein